MSETYVEERPRILSVDQDPKTNFAMVKALETWGYETLVASNVDEALEILKEEKIKLVFLDDSTRTVDKLDGLVTIRDKRPDVSVVMMVQRRRISAVVECMRLGAQDCLTKPIADEQLQQTVENCFKALRLEHELEDLRKQVERRRGLDRIIGNSVALRRATEMVRRVAGHPISVLINGDSGTGKELFAEAIHQLSPRAQGPFISVDCASFPSDLVESELFGYYKGAFTGATENKPGRFELADGGTLFLDEIGNLSLNVQKKLLRVLQERKVARLGSKHLQSIDVRIVAATNVNLKDAIIRGEFREDLYHRLNEFSVRLPPLRERNDDVELLARFFLHRFNNQFSRSITGFSREAMDRIRQYPWPGNVRELHNCIKRAAVLSEDRIELEDLPADLMDYRLPEPEKEMGIGSVPASDQLAFHMPEGILPLWDAAQMVIQEVERKYIQKALLLAHWNKMKAAKLLNIHFKTLYQKMREYQID